METVGGAMRGREIGKMELLLYDQELICNVPPLKIVETLKLCDVTGIAES